MTEAAEIAFTESEKHNILSNIHSLLTEEKLMLAIKGNAMVCIFTRAIRNITLSSKT